MHNEIFNILNMKTKREPTKNHAQITMKGIFNPSKEVLRQEAGLTAMVLVMTLETVSFKSQALLCSPSDDWQ